MKKFTKDREIRWRDLIPETHDILDARGNSVFSKLPVDTGFKVAADIEIKPTDLRPIATNLKKSHDKLYGYRSKVERTTFYNESLDYKNFKTNAIYPTVNASTIDDTYVGELRYVASNLNGLLANQKSEFDRLRDVNVSASISGENHGRLNSLDHIFTCILKNIGTEVLDFDEGKSNKDLAAVAHQFILQKKVSDSMKLVVGKKVNDNPDLSEHSSKICNSMILAAYRKLHEKYNDLYESKIKPIITKIGSDIDKKGEDAYKSLEIPFFKGTTTETYKSKLLYGSNNNSYDTKDIKKIVSNVNDHLTNLSKIAEDKIKQLAKVGKYSDFDFKDHNNRIDKEIQTIKDITTELAKLDAEYKKIVGYVGTPGALQVYTAGKGKSKQFYDERKIVFGLIDDGTNTTPNTVANELRNNKHFQSNYTNMCNDILKITSEDDITFKSLFNMYHDVKTMLSNEKDLSKINLQIYKNFNDFKGNIGSAWTYLNEDLEYWWTNVHDGIKSLVDVNISDNDVKTLEAFQTDIKNINDCFSAFQTANSIEKTITVQESAEPIPGVSDKKVLECKFTQVPIPYLDSYKIDDVDLVNAGFKNDDGFVNPPAITDIKKALQVIKLATSSHTLRNQQLSSTLEIVAKVPPAPALGYPTKTGPFGRTNFLKTCDKVLKGICEADAKLGSRISNMLGKHVPTFINNGGAGSPPTDKPVSIDNSNVNFAKLDEKRSDVLGFLEVAGFAKIQNISRTIVGIINQIYYRTLELTNKPGSYGNADEPGAKESENYNAALKKIKFVCESLEEMKYVRYLNTKDFGLDLKATNAADAIKAIKDLLNDSKAYGANESKTKNNNDHDAPGWGYTSLDVLKYIINAFDVIYMFGCILNDITGYMTKPEDHTFKTLPNNHVMRKASGPGTYFLGPMESKINGAIGYINTDVTTGTTVNNVETYYGTQELGKIGIGVDAQDDGSVAVALLTGALVRQPTAVIAMAKIIKQFRKKFMEINIMQVRSDIIDSYTKIRFLNPLTIKTDQKSVNVTGNEISENVPINEFLDKFILFGLEPTINNFIQADIALRQISTPKTRVNGLFRDKGFTDYLPRYYLTNGFEILDEKGNNITEDDEWIEKRHPETLDDYANRMDLFSVDAAANTLYYAAKYNYEFQEMSKAYENALKKLIDINKITSEVGLGKDKQAAIPTAFVFEAPQALSSSEAYALSQNWEKQSKPLPPSISAATEYTATRYLGEIAETTNDRPPNAVDKDKWDLTAGDIFNLEGQLYIAVKDMELAEFGHSFVAKKYNILNNRVYIQPYNSTLGSHVLTVSGGASNNSNQEMEHGSDQEIDYYGGESVFEDIPVAGGFFGGDDAASSTLGLLAGMFVLSSRTIAILIVIILVVVFMMWSSSKSKFVGFAPPEYRTKAGKPNGY